MCVYKQRRIGEFIAVTNTVRGFQHGLETFVLGRANFCGQSSTM